MIKVWSLEYEPDLCTLLIKLNSDKKRIHCFGQKLIENNRDFFF